MLSEYISTPLLEITLLHVNSDKFVHFYNSNIFFFKEEKNLYHFRQSAVLLMIIESTFSCMYHRKFGKE